MLPNTSGKRKINALTSVRDLSPMSTIVDVKK